MGKPPIFAMIKLLFNPDVSKKMILQIAFQQISAIGYIKVLSLLLSTSIVGASSIIKIPQIKKIINPKLLTSRISVAQGLSLDGISLESFNYLIHVIYNKQNNNLFMNYGEALLLGIQNIAIILLIEYYNARNHLEQTSHLENGDKVKISLQHLTRPIAIIIAIGVGLSKVAPSALINGLQVLNIPIGIAAKLPQIKKNYELKSTSHLSNVTIGANVFGSLSRVFTTVQSFDKLGRDYVLLAGYSSSFVLNGVLAGQCYYYGKREKGEKKEE